MTDNERKVFEYLLSKGDTVTLQKLFEEGLIGKKLFERAFSMIDKTDLKIIVNKEDSLSLENLE